MARIPQPFIDQVLNQTDIVDLINAYIELKPKGKEYTACCPFHSEKTPSFTVSPEKQFYHCFGCGAHGTAVSFIMQHENLSFIEAIETLAARLGLEVPREVGSQAADGEQQRLFEILTRSSEFYAEQLRHDRAAQTYLRGRKINAEIANEFKLGFAPEAFNHLQGLVSQQFSDELLLNSGLYARAKSGSLYERFRNRIMFPIRDYRGRVIAYGGRAIEEGVMPKYINSPETPVFHKGRVLYGMYEARQALGRFSQAIVVEGYMDVIALAQHNIRNVVATLGTATTQQHMQTLLRFVREVVFCFDGDTAGRKAAWKALQIALSEFKDGVDIRFMFLPKGEDPDSFVRQAGRGAFLEAVSRAQPLAEFFFSELKTQADITTAAGKARLAAQAQPLLARIPPGVFRSLMYQELQQIVGTKLQEAPAARSTAANSATTLKQPAQGPGYSKTRLAIALLLREPGLYRFALPADELSRIKNQPGMLILIKMLQILEESPTLSTQALLERFAESKVFAQLQQLVLWNAPDMDNRQQSFQDTMQAFKRDIERQRWDELINSQKH